MSFLWLYNTEEMYPLNFHISNTLLYYPLGEDICLLKYKNILDQSDITVDTCLHAVNCGLVPSTSYGLPSLIKSDP